MARALRILAVVAAFGVSLASCSGCTEETEDCPSGQERCQGFCRDPASYATDPGNCGACGVVCGFGTCAGGTCQCEGGTLCAGRLPRCSDLSTDPLNCGACGNDCPKVNEGCAGGTCQCLPPFPDDCGALCADLLTDAANCSACGAACPLTNDVCVAGACACPAALPDTCGSTCVDLDTDDANCGTCGNDCPLANDLCEGGSCVCPASLPDACPTACVDHDTDESNCGACGSACASGANCETGLCTCPPATPVACGGTGAGGSCCAGNGCCASNACQTEHTNGLGQHFYDCSPLYEPASTTTRTAALAAADAWATGTTYDGTVCDPYCIARQTGSSCAVWCYGASSLAGRVKSIASLVCDGACPYSGYSVWK